ncbi:MAG TPA: lipopolysaccharide biosynthesis protein [Micromonosporaceae bacterium]|nr:lipopolysaccharide biosynthesis protein [Micromonosporaceae bacterium]
MDVTRPIYHDILDRPVPRDTDLRVPDLVNLVRRHWWLLTLLLALGVVGAAKFTERQPTVYESATSVLVQPTGSGQDTNVVGGRTRGELNLDTEAQLVRSTPVAAVAAELLRSPTAPDELARNVAVKVPANTSVLVISYSGRTAQLAQAGSHAFAEAYLRSREESDRAELASRTAAIDAKVKQLNTVLTQLNARIVTLRPDTSDRANLESQRQTTVSQLNTLNSQVNQISTTAPNAGRIIRDAGLPAAPVKPNRLLNLASGAMLGLLLGIGAGYLRQRLDRRVRRAADLARRVDVAVLADLPPRMRPPVDQTFPPFGTGGRLFHRLRNEILASIAPAPGATQTHAVPSGQVLVVAGAARSAAHGAPARLVAANLAAAFARTDAETVLICAHRPGDQPDPVPLTDLLGVRTAPGLTDVLTGRVALSTALQDVPGHRHLRVLTSGTTSDDDGLLQSRALRETLTAVRAMATYVVIEAPSTTTSADAQSLASMSDGAILAVELRRTRYRDVRDAVEQLRRVGTPLVGAVVLAKLPKRRGSARPALAGNAAATPAAEMPAAGAPPAGRIGGGHVDAVEPRTTDLDCQPIEQVHPAQRIRPPVPAVREDAGSRGAETLLTARPNQPGARLGPRPNARPTGSDGATAPMPRNDRAEPQRAADELAESGPGDGGAR